MKKFAGLDAITTMISKLKSAFAAAKEGGYTGTEADFNSKLAQLGNPGYLPLTGGTITGPIRYKTASYISTPIQIYEGDQYGQAIVMQAGGLVVIGGGEAASNLYNALITAGKTPGIEELHLCADSAVYIHPNCQTIANRKTITIDTSGKITSPGGFCGPGIVARFTVNLPTGGYTQNSSTKVYSKDVAVSGIKATDVPIIDVVLSADPAAAKLQLAAWACVTRIETKANAITVYCNESAPTTAITLSIVAPRAE